ncbi:MAG: bifunctional histidinol-phosphatase/imidazoleglycerol-phosphate dehydratase HisB [Ornithinimicrobium sp.]|uniref:bifunctional histidinol-phosphatase/imidazoleglycerol-phosphate dehydratase HisB n=1 Tax=Ornithinimicrobium sp. TaxID=1977084 RepID=UPI0026E00E60|nr:bifunctional histidinol-phosphatase/imidazoleglycerol-phosphate dehydratase HisB [Ornithinimicrobium sp.]MDO5741194.1 bifunctional histidinol-phosphatase/imidazoleglycerol-phosphate dehydratase HisB [Ornithinimicrobium sp.]
MSTPRPICFVDRDGTILAEPEDFQVDRLDKVAFVDGVIPALLKIQDAGFDLIMVTNQDGLGTESFPQEDFDGPQELMMQILTSQGITFREVIIDPHHDGPQAPWTRKPGIGRVVHLLKDTGVDWSRSVMVGDRRSDQEFGDNLGIQSYLLPSPAGSEGLSTTSWSQIAHTVVDRPRVAHVERSTAETRITVSVDLDGTPGAQATTGIGFYDHMLDQLAKHGGFSMSVHCEGDLHIDDHHTIEDVALAVGQAIREGLGDKRGIGRYGFTLPMDEAQATAAIDLSGRPFFAYEGTFDRPSVGDFSTEMVEHFWRSFADALRCTLHLSVSGENTHHKIEVGFKAVARALRMAIARQGDANELPSTKGVL